MPLVADNEAPAKGRLVPDEDPNAKTAEETPPLSKFDLYTTLGKTILQAGMTPRFTLPSYPNVHDAPEDANVLERLLVAKQQVGNAAFNTLKTIPESFTSPIGAGAGVLGLAGRAVPAALTLSKVAALLFSADMARQAGQGTGEAIDVLNDPNASLQEKLQSVLAPATTGVMAVAGAKGAMPEPKPPVLPKPEPLPKPKPNPEILAKVESAKAGQNLVIANLKANEILEPPQNSPFLPAPKTPVEALPSPLTALSPVLDTQTLPGTTKPLETAKIGQGVEKARKAALSDFDAIEEEAAAQNQGRLVPTGLTAKQVEGMGGEDLVKHYQEAQKAGGNGLTEDAKAAGEAAKTKEEIDTLKKKRDEFNEQAQGILSSPDFNNLVDPARKAAAADQISTLAAKAQFFSEAYQAATKTGIFEEKPTPQPNAPAIKSPNEVPLLNPPGDGSKVGANDLGRQEPAGAQEPTNAERKAKWDAEKAVITKEILSAPSKGSDLMEPSVSPGWGGSPLKKITEAVTGAGRDVVNAYKKYRISTMLPDQAFNRMDASQQDFGGPLVKHFRSAFDTAGRISSQFRKSFVQPVLDAIGSENLNELQRKRVGVYAELQQEGGEGFIRASKVPKEVVDDIKKNGLTPAEKAIYDAGRKTFDNEMFPKVAALAKELYNIDLQKVENYWPRQRDYDLAQTSPEEATSRLDKGGEMGVDEFLKLRGAIESGRPFQSTKTKQGFLIEREQDAANAIQFDAIKTFDRAATQAGRFLAYSKPLKMASEIARSPEFGAKYGKLNQDWTLKQLEVTSKGTAVGARSILLDLLNRNAVTGIIAGRIGNLKHASNIPFAWKEVGGKGAFEKAVLDTTKGTDAHKFIMDNVPDVARKAGSEQSILDLVEGKGALDKTRAAGFWVERYIDYKIAAGTWWAKYKQVLEQQGIDPSDAANQPVNEKAFQAAQITTRKVVTSPMAENLSHIQSRGSLTGNNVSYAKALTAFHSTMIRHFDSNIIHEVFDLGLAKKNYKYAALSFLAVAASAAIEESIKALSHNVIDYVTGHKSKNKSSIPVEVARYAADRVPGLGPPAIAAFTGRGTGVPIVDTGSRGAAGAGKLVMGTGQYGKPLGKLEASKAKIDVAAAVAELGLGLPLSSLAAELEQKSLPRQRK